MYIQHALHSRSNIEIRSSDGEGLGRNTIIFIVLGVVCFLAILIGFYLVSRPRAACNAAPNVSGLHLQHSPTTPPPHLPCQRDMSKHWKLWRLWRHPDSTTLPDTAHPPVSHLSPAPVTIATPPRVLHAGGGSDSNAYPAIILRPSQPRRVTTLSVATSFSHSHITEDAFSDLRASAYDLDGDLETEMLHSARDDVWPGLPSAVEDERGEGGTEVRSNATPVVEGSVGLEGDAPTRLATLELKGGDYENLLSVCQKVTCSSDGVEVGVSEVDE